MNPLIRTLFAAAAFCVLTSPLTSPAAEKPKNEECLACHSDATLTKEVNGKQVSVHVDPDKLKNSIHGQMFQCVDCHTDVKSSPHLDTPKKVECSTCHADEAAKYTKSLHAKPAAGGAPAATCADCHGDVHEVIPTTEASSKISHGKVAETCAQCHSQEPMMKANGLSSAVVTAYKSSVHAKALAAGNEKSATCTDCHTAHEVAPASDPNSKIAKVNQMTACAQCHAEASSAFKQSVHGQSVLKGNSMAPSCTGCHGIHAIQSKNDPNSVTAFGNVSKQTCARCHDDTRLTEEFGVPGNRVSTYLDSYHGLAMMGGSKGTANCASCHSAHNILNSADPRATTNPAHLMQTCGQCHQGVTAQFVATKVHFDAVPSAPANDLGTQINRWVRWIYLALIVCTIGGMAGHNVIVWVSKTRRRRETQNPFLTRMTVRQRWQHLTLLVSFITLAITGFALKFPNSWLALHSNTEFVRALLHRVAGVVLIVAGLYHMIYLATTCEGRRMFREMLPMPKDGFDAIGTMLYYLGLSSKKPKFGRFNYAEKVEYWALVWGTIVMAMTGIMMWAKVTTGSLVPRWWIEVATTIHFYEAILATLAILVWHFYMVFFDPDVYPMNGAWLNGKMPVSLYKHEHELDTEALKEVDGLDETTDSGPEQH